MQEETSNTAAAPVETAAAPEAPINAHMRWYILHAYSGFSRKVRESLESTRAGVCIAEQDWPGFDPD